MCRLGYGTRLSGYITLDLAEDKYASPKPWYLS
jgi:hypothetical protein